MNKQCGDTGVRVRFAPSPTGYMHIGNARTALFNWFFAKKHNGTFIVRIEDTDRERSKEEYTQAMLEDLNWLQLPWNEGPDIGGEYGPYTQSMRSQLYTTHFETLKSKGHIYPCFCQPDELDFRRKEAMKNGTAPKYDNRCRDLTEKDIQEKTDLGIKPSWRFKVPERIVRVDDIIRGTVEFDTSIMGDFVIMKSGGIPTFHFAVCIDDGLMKISHVIRGEDHLSNTPKHVLLFEALGYPLPLFAHMPMIMGPDGQRLSKRHGVTSVSEFRELGYLPEALKNYLALLGWAPKDNKEIMGIDEMVDEFSLERVNKSASIFDYTKLNWVNANYLRNTDCGRITDLAMPYLARAGLIKENVDECQMEEITKIVQLVLPYLRCLSEVSEHVEKILNDTIVLGPEEKEIVKDSAILFQEFISGLGSEECGVDYDWKAYFSAVMKKTGLKGKQFYMPLRIAITGSAHGPELIDVINILGKIRCCARVGNILEQIQ